MFEKILFCNLNSILLRNNEAVCSHYHCLKECKCCVLRFSLSFMSWKNIYFAWNKFLNVNKLRRERIFPLNCYYFPSDCWRKNLQAARLSCFLINQCQLKLNFHVTILLYINRWLLFSAFHHDVIRKSIKIEISNNSTAQLKMWLYFNIKENT